MIVHHILHPSESRKIAIEKTLHHSLRIPTDPALALSLRAAGAVVGCRAAGPGDSGDLWSRNQKMGENTRGIHYKYLMEFCGVLNINGLLVYHLMKTTTGWWLSLPLWKIWVNWDDDIPNIWKKTIMFQTTNKIYVYIRILYMHMCVCI